MATVSNLDNYISSVIIDGTVVDVHKCHLEIVGISDNYLCRLAKRRLKHRIASYVNARLLAESGSRCLTTR